MIPYYESGGIVIYHGDGPELMMLINADVLLCDPPYGIAYESGWPGISWWQGQQIANDDSLEVRDAIVSYWGDDRPGFVFGSWKVPPPVGTRTVLVWDKGPALGMGDLSLPWKPNWEHIYVIGRGFQGYRGTSVLQFPPVQSMAKNGRLHPNQKPVPLLKALLLSTPGGTVLDPCMGVGSTLVAAKELGLPAVGIEIEERYCEIAARRLSQDVLPLWDAVNSL